MFYLVTFHFAFESVRITISPTQLKGYKMKFKPLLLSACALLLLASQPGYSQQIKIGMAIDDLRLSVGKKTAIFLSRKPTPWGPMCLFSRPTAMKKPKWRRSRI
ncbi:D-xylose transporter subunit XylF [Serratia fonticola]|uniref:D-xylose transporter subunit XylF n=1 Tax=Serratia fonticola TaxID=47917 RepID=A0A4U9VFE5_SERFO|nr:D-xylose transporter subunit XylF [Serratia fonticola]